MKIVPAALAVTPTQLQQRLSANETLTVIDLRSPTLYAQEHIPGAINIPASLIGVNKLPPLGKVIVYDSGLGASDAGAAQAAADALAKSSGISAEILDGGYAAWQSAHMLTTRGRGATREALHYVTYAQLKTVKADETVLVDLRRPAKVLAQSGVATTAAAAPLTDLVTEFPGLRVVKSTAEISKLATGATPPLLVLIDNGDGTAEAAARLCKAAGNRRYAILAGGEFILARHGEAGLQRAGTGATAPGPGKRPIRPSN